MARAGDLVPAFADGLLKMRWINGARTLPGLDRTELRLLVGQAREAGAEQAPVLERALDGVRPAELLRVDLAAVEVPLVLILRQFDARLVALTSPQQGDGNKHEQEQSKGPERAGLLVLVVDGFLGVGHR